MSKKQLSTQSSALSPVMIVGPIPPPYGGMALQGQLLYTCLGREGIQARLIPTNPQTAFDKIKGIRTVAQSLVFILRLVRELRGVGVVHILAASHLYFFLRVVPAVILGRLHGRRIILNYRGGAAAAFFSVWGFMVRPILRRVQVITVPSVFLKRVFADLGFAAEVIPNLVDLERFAPSALRPAPPQESQLTPHPSALSPNMGPHLLVTRNFEPMYNVKMALQAFEIIKQRHPSASLDVVGSGRQEAELKAWVEERGLKDVSFHGPVPNERIPLFLERADILLNPSSVDNMPINLLEAFASGVPVITTRAGGIPDLVGEEKAALLVEAGDYSEMAEKVEALIRSPKKAREITTYAREFCKEFSWDAVRRRLLEVYYPQTAAGSQAELLGERP